jgi:riboflavin synthase
MFTGLVAAVGEVVSVERRAGAVRLVVAGTGDAGRELIARLREGDSVAVSGVCLTALEIQPASTGEPGPKGAAGERSGGKRIPGKDGGGEEVSTFAADLAEETLARTTLGGLGVGAVVNLELPTPAGDPLGGHVVQGHVDGVGTLVALDAVRPGAEGTDWVLRVRVPAGLMKYVAGQGSITVEGISLTVAEVSADEVRIAVIPHTYAATNLRTLRVGDGVNLEVDVLAKYAERRGETVVRSALTVEYLLANGY